jgi:hypothetical protein
MKRKVITIAALLGAASAASIVGTARIARSSDHLDAPATKADPAADINDLYSWVDGSNLVLALTVFPAATGASDAGAGSQFSNTVQYVIHTASGTAFGNTSAKEDIICTFSAAQVISCWVGSDEYVTGNASVASTDGGPIGLTSADGKVKIFAGLRADPFFFNLDGFHHAEATVEGAEEAGALTFDQASCPQLDPATASTLRTQLQTSLDGGLATDFFAPLNTLAIVVAVDKSLVTKGGTVVSAWASTHVSPS